MTAHAQTRVSARLGGSGVGDILRHLTAFGDGLAAVCDPKLDEERVGVGICESIVRAEEGERWGRAGGRALAVSATRAGGRMEAEGGEVVGGAQSVCVCVCACVYVCARVCACVCARVCVCVCVM